MQIIIEAEEYLYHSQIIVGLLDDDYGVFVCIMVVCSHVYVTQ